MRTLSIAGLQDIERELLVRYKARMDMLNAFGESYQGRASPIAAEIYSECAIHLRALTSTTEFLVEELVVWLGSQPDALNPDRAGDLMAEEFARRSLEACLNVIGLDETGKIFELGYVILEKSIELSTAKVPLEVMRIIKALKEIEMVSGLPTSDVKTASKVLLELELFMRTALIVAQWATSQVHLVTQDSPADASSSKELVVFYLREARSEMAKRGRKEWLCFPQDGLWPD
jgi:hypothetical protein